MSNLQSTFCVDLWIFVCLRWWITLILSFCMGVICPRWLSWYLIVRLCNNPLCVFKWFTHNSSLLLRLPIDVGKLGYWSTSAVAVTNLNLIMVRHISVCVHVYWFGCNNTNCFEERLRGSTRVPCFFVNTWMSKMCVYSCVWQSISNQVQRGKRFPGQSYKYVYIYNLKTSQ